MRSRRLAFILLAFYLTFIGGSAYYVLVFPIRFFHHGFMTVLLALWLFGRIRNGRGIPYTPLNIPIYALVAVWFVTVTTSLDPRMAFESVWFLILHTIIFFVLVDLFQRGRQKLVMETQFLMGAVVVLITGLELASWYFGLGLIPNTDIGWFGVRPIPLEVLRVSLAMNISTLLAGYVAPLIMLSIGWALTARRRDYRQVLWILAALLIAVLLLTFSRGGLLSLAAALGAFTIMRVVQIQNRASPRVLLGLASIAAIIGLAGFMVFTLSGSRGSGDSGRLDMYRSAIAITADYPVTGVGPGQYGRTFRTYRDPELARDKLASAHNYYLNTGAETGLLGIAVNLWLGGVLLMTWWRRWQEADTSARKLRLEAVFAALIGVAIHSLVDVFTTTPVVLVILVLLAYSITGNKDVLNTPPPGQRLPAVVGLVIVLGYGVFFFQIDRAQTHYQLSLVRSGEDALEQARAAERIDPYLNLYDLQIANLTGRQLDYTTNQAPDELIALYERAIALEPTWDTGLMNLATLELRRGEIENAQRYLEDARAINHLSRATLNLAELLDMSGGADDDFIVELYHQGIANARRSRGYLPLSDYWTQTELRRHALDQYIEDQNIELQYRILSVNDPERALALVPEAPNTATEWWITGEHALSVDAEPSIAADAFSQAIDLNPRRGDYYVARARAHVALGDMDAAQADLDLAYLLGTGWEQRNLVRAQITGDPELAESYRVTALPPRIIGQEFAAVLYGGRFSDFDYFMEMRYPGPGHIMMQPWYTLAEQNPDDARRIYREIIRYAPDEIDNIPLEAG